MDVDGPYAQRYVKTKVDRIASTVRYFLSWHNMSFSVEGSCIPKSGHVTVQMPTDYVFKRFLMCSLHDVTPLQRLIVNLNVNRVESG